MPTGPGKSPVERFMQFYFLHAKTVGDLTGVFLAHLDEQFGKKGRRFALPTLRRRPRSLDGFTLDRGRLTIPSRRLVRRAAGAAGRDVRACRARRAGNPPGRDARRGARRAQLSTQVRDDPRANAFFLDVLTNSARPTSCCGG